MSEADRRERVDREESSRRRREVDRGDRRTEKRGGVKTLGGRDEREN